MSKDLHKTKDKKVYSKPELVVFGGVNEITKKERGITDHNQSPNGIDNDMGWPSS